MIVSGVVVAMRVPFDLDVARHDEDALAYPQDLDLGAIEGRQDRAGDHLVHGSEHGPAASHVEPAIDRVEQGVELMGAEQNGDTEVPLQP